MVGQVYRYARGRGFGFIRGEDGGNYFFNMCDFDGPFPEPGTVVEFAPTNTPKGLRAVDVRRKPE